MSSDLIDKHNTVPCGVVVLRSNSLAVIVEDDYTVDGWNICWSHRRGIYSLHNIKLRFGHVRETVYER